MIYRELLRPQVHFSPKKNWMNDPNGCVYFKGLYHLYFQYYPHDILWGPMHWGHAVSKDLLHWEEKGIALYPDEETGMAFSGSAIVDSDNASGIFPDGPGLLAFYTGHFSGADESSSVEHQCLAYSPDDGTSWVGYKGNPVLPNPGEKDFRDPKVFYHKDSQAWVMVVAAGYEVRFFRSTNLINWKESGRFGNGHGLQDGLWECPDIFPLSHPDVPESEIWVLAVSCLCKTKPEYSPMQYFLGIFDGDTFQNSSAPERIRLVDYGHDFYATQSWFGLPNQEERTVWIGWANHWAYARNVPTKPWRGVMSIPRELRLAGRGDDLVLIQTPIRELDTLRQDQSDSRNASVSDPCELIYTIANATQGNAVVRFLFDGGGELAIRWDGVDRLLTVDRGKVSLQNFHPEFNTEPSVTIPNENDCPNIDIRLILDRSLVEVFTMSGAYTLTCQIFPEGHLKAIKTETSREVELMDLQTFNLDSIWNPEITKSNPLGVKGETQ
jgi:fructan beta-fructosidase